LAEIGRQGVFQGLVVTDVNDPDGDRAEFVKMAETSELLSPGK